MRFLPDIFISNKSEDLFLILETWSPIPCLLRWFHYDLQDARCWLSLLFRRRKDEILNAFQRSFTLCSFMQNVYLVRLFGVSNIRSSSEHSIGKARKYAKLTLEAWVFSV